MDSVAVVEMGRNGMRPAPSSGWFVQERSAKPMKEVSPAVGGGVTKASTAAMAAAAVEAANKKRAELAKAEPGSKKRTKTVRVRQEYIDHLLKRYPFKPYPGEASQLEKNMPASEARDQLCIMLAPTAALIKSIRDEEEAIIKQYLAQGYAEEEVDVDDEEA